VLAILVLIAVTRLPAVAHPRALSDEAYYAVVANEMLHGGLPYRDAVDRKPPLLYGIFWAVFRVAGYPNWPVVHLAALGWTLATMALLFLLGRQLFTPLTGVIAALLYGAFQSYLTITNLAFNGEMMMNLRVVPGRFVGVRRNCGPVGRAPGESGALAALEAPPHGVSPIGEMEARVQMLCRFGPGTRCASAALTPRGVGPRRARPVHAGAGGWWR
jgi:hypothetical protein